VGSTVSAIERIYIACYRWDVRLTRILVASIRRWYPDHPIVLIKDHRYGDFNTNDIERTHGASVYDGPRRVFGWGFGKIEPLFDHPRRRVLVLDSDIVFVGRVLDVLERFDEDFIVQEEGPPSDDFLRENYFDLDGLRLVDPAFEFPHYTFNTGQIVATTGLLSRGLFDPHVVWNDPPRVRRPEVFKLGEQGLLNYLLMRAEQDRRVSLRRVRFMELPTATAVASLDVDTVSKGLGPPLLLHWCGLQSARPEDSPRADLLTHFEAAYYERVPAGRWLKYRRCTAEHLRRAVSQRFGGGRVLRRLTGSGLWRRAS
jgi:hypothetical protein